MLQKITAIHVQVEQSVYTDDGKLVSRPNIQPFVVFESDIPAPVLQWVSEQLAKRGA